MYMSTAEAVSKGMRFDSANQMGAQLGESVFNLGKSACQIYPVSPSVNTRNRVTTIN